jgi:hypothetical protein
VKAVSLAEIRTARRANTDVVGIIKNAALDRRLQAAERAECIRLLGWQPEPAGIGPCHPNAYAASCGEMIVMLREKTEDPT